MHPQVGKAAHMRVSAGARVLDFTYTFGVVFYNRGDLTGPEELPNPSQALPVFPPF